MHTRDWQQKRLNNNTWLAPFEKGIVLHAILEAFWREIANQQQLLALSESALENKFNALINKILPKHIRKGFSDIYIAVEKARILQILKDYCDLEKSEHPLQ